MSIKKLLKEGITYNTLRKIFEDCCSFLDFYEVMKTYGIERKVSKVMALHFSGIGLQNQGAIAHSRLHEEKPNQGAAESQAERTKGSQRDHCENKPQQNTVSADSLQDGKSSNQEEATEDWEREVATAVPRKNFTLKCITPAPLSLVLDDLSYARQGKTRGVESQIKPEVACLQPKAEVDLSLSEKQRPQGKAARAEVRNGSTYSARKAPKQRVERTVKWKKPFKEIEQDGRLSKKVTFSKRENKREVVTKKQSKSVSPSEKDKHATESKPSVCSLSSNEMTPENELKKQPFEGHCSSTGCSVAKWQPPVISGLDGNSSTTDLVQKFASVFIGDIAILVPVECGEKDYVSNVTELNKPDTHVQDHTKEAGSAKDSPVVDIAPVAHSPHVPLETHVGDLTIDDSSNYTKVVDSSQQISELSAGNAMLSVVSSSQSEHEQSHPQSPHRSSETSFEVRAEANTRKLKGDTEVIDTLPNFESSEGNGMISSWVSSNVRSEQGLSHPQSPFETVEGHAPDQAEVATVRSSLHLKQSSGNATILDQVVSRVEEEKINENSYLDGEVTSSNNFIPPANASSGGREVLEEADHQVATSIVDTISVNSQHPACSVNNESTTEGNNGLISSWAEISAYLPNDVSPPSDLHEEPSLGSFGMNRGFATGLIDTESANQAHCDLQAELSSESSSTSGDQSVDVHIFSRQPPLGEERGFTPDAVQQQPNQLPWVGNAIDGIPQLHSGPGFNYSQASFPSLGNPHGAFHQAYHALPLLKPCYPSFPYSRHVRPGIPPHMMQQHPQQVFMPQFQYRNQMMFSNIVPPSVGFPAVPQSQFPGSQFQPQMFPFLQAAASGFPCFSRVNPYEQVQQAAGPPVDVSGLVFTNSATALSQGSPVVNDYPIPTLDSSSSQGSDAKEDASSDTSSSDSSFEQMVTSPANQADDNSTLTHESFPAQTENDLGYSASVACKDSQKELEEELKEKSFLSGDNRDSQVFTLAQLCYKEVSSDNVSLNKLTSSKVFASHQQSESQEDPVHKQITILSREESVMGMGRRLSPDGSSVEGVCLDVPSGDTNSVHKDKVFKGKSSSSSNWDNLSGEYYGFRPNDIKEKEKEKITDSGPSPKPQRIKAKRTRRDKSTQASSVLVSSHKDLQPGNELSDTCPDVNGQPVSSKSNNNNNSSKQEDLGLNFAKNTSRHSNSKKSHRKVRFSKEDSERQSREASTPSDTPHKLLTRQEKQNAGSVSVQEISRLTCNEDRDINDLEGKHRRSKDKSFTKSSNVDGLSIREVRNKDRPQRRTEKRVDMDSRPAHGAWKRGRGDKRPYKEKLSTKGSSEEKVPQTGTRTDKNNNS